MDEKVGRILNEARQAIADAEFNLNGKRFHVVSNRAYYAVFHCIQALLQNEGVFVKTHHGAQQKFHQLFIKTGKFTLETGEILAYLSELRNLGDYDYGTTIQPIQAKQAVEKAVIFLEKTIKYIG